MFLLACESHIVVQYSSVGLTSVLYAICFISCVQPCRFLLKNSSEQLALEQYFPTWGQVLGFQRGNLLRNIKLTSYCPIERKKIPYNVSVDFSSKCCESVHREAC